MASVSLSTKSDNYMAIHLAAEGDDVLLLCKQKTELTVLLQRNVNRVLLSVGRWDAARMNVNISDLIRIVTAKSRRSLLGRRAAKTHSVHFRSSSTDPPTAGGSVDRAGVSDLGRPGSAVGRARGVGGWPGDPVGQYTSETSGVVTTDDGPARDRRPAGPPSIGTPIDCGGGRHWGTEI